MWPSVYSFPECTWQAEETGEGVSKGPVVWSELDLIKSSAWGNGETMEDMAGSDGADIWLGVGWGRPSSSAGLREAGGAGSRARGGGGGCSSIFLQNC